MLVYLFIKKKYSQQPIIVKLPPVYWLSRWAMKPVARYVTMGKLENLYKPQSAHL